MKLLKITTLYPDYLRDFYASRSGLAEKPFAEQKAALDHDASGWADYWSQAMTPLGYEMAEATWNAELLQRAWAWEHGVAGAGLQEIALAQAKAFRPDVLWFDDPNEELLRQIRAVVPSIRLVLGWTGSAVPKTEVWRQMDLVLSCAPEAVAKLRQDGFRVEQLHHGFEPRINSRLQVRPKRFDFSFIGQLLRAGEFHMQRERLLERLADQITVTIFSPSAGLTLRDDVRAYLMVGLYDVLSAARRFGVPESLLRALPVMRRAACWQSRPSLLVSRRLRPFIRPAVFGLKMFQTLRDSRTVLNIHADSSPRFASNMRLFETTGVGSCLVTDWRENLAELFEPDREVVVYRTAEECSEKVRWLLDHPRELEAIGRAGQARTLRDHTFACRALRLDEIIRKELASR